MSCKLEFIWYNTIPYLIPSLKTLTLVLYWWCFWTLFFFFIFSSCCTTKRSPSRVIANILELTIINNYTVDHSWQTQQIIKSYYRRIRQAQAIILRTYQLLIHLYFQQQENWWHCPRMRSSHLQLNSPNHYSLSSLL